ncbi:xanthine dehydrogenase small subunit [Nocardioides sp. S5]|uniref:xanthine dehydrogenase small subunit n=1 Tax=Nocardioides sp. S5 TaxID=2017486 RepID=UPI001A8DF875|nr:FAD binding domain-containing protein [Nocardioides sp. S5]QSR31883.1 xanthine dehydrogenase small subunit [Nocardioides sp. S5]
MEMHVNGRQHALPARPHVNLLDYLRGLGLTGAKEGCAEGECGACAVLVARPTADGGGATWTALNSCLPASVALAGQEVVTAEGLGSPQALHPVQREMAERGGSQCGYCTPGFVCSMAAEFYRADRTPVDEGQEPSEEHGPNGFDLHALSGNLCRCTGYRPIRDAAYALGEPAAGDPLAGRCAAPAPRPVVTDASDDSGRYVRPASLTEVLDLLAGDPTAVPVAGATDHGVEVNLRGRRDRLVVGIDRLAELRGLEVGDDAVEIGAALTLTEVEERLAGRVPLLDALVPQFASRLIRNAATLGGNLGTASPIGDAAPVLLALDASLVLAHADGEREVALADYFTGYRETVRRPGELIRAVRVPLPTASMTAFHKIAKRRFDDISSVAVAFALDLGPTDGGAPVVRRARVGLGGVAAVPLRALATEQALEGRPWTEETVEHAARVLRGEGTPLSDQRASADYRSAMLGNALRRLWAESHEPGPTTRSGGAGR